MKSIEELAKKTEAQLQQSLMEYRDKLRDMRFRVSQKQLKNIREIRDIKKNIAQILTVLNSKK